MKSERSDFMQVRNLSPNTQQSYIDQVARFAQHFHRSPDQLGPEHIRDYQLFLASVKGLAASSIAVATAALRFLYRVTLGKDWNIPEVLPTPKQPKRLPVVPSAEEVARFLAAVPNRKHHAILTTCYAAGLRISEAVQLRPRDIDSRRMVIRVEQGKGAKDRYVMLSPRLLQVLRNYWRHTRPDGEWLFPGASPGRPLSADAVGRVCRPACARAGIDKRITPHALRHGFAVHLLENGADVRTIQLLLGHRGLAVTANYLRITASQVCSATSPFDLLPALPTNRSAADR